MILVIRLVEVNNSGVTLSHYQKGQSGIQISPIEVNLFLYIDESYYICAEKVTI